MIFIAICLFNITLILTILAPMPGRVAKKRNHPHAKIIRRCGWIAVLSSSPAGWILALQWAYKEPNEPISNLEERIALLEKKARRRRFLFDTSHKSR